MTDQAQCLAGEVLEPGDLAVDLTAGTGRDTLYLWDRVAPGGRVFAFDIQRQALEGTAERLAVAGAPVHPVRVSPGTIPPAPGLVPVAACHSRLAEFLPAAPRVVIANLGYLPGGPRELVTRPGTTLCALQQAARLLRPGGRLVVVAYPGHPGGDEETAAVIDWFTGLAPSEWQVLALERPNHPRAPRLRVAAKCPVNR